MVVIIYSRIAGIDLKDIYNYIAKDSKHYAKTETKLIRQFIAKLKLNIYLGKSFEKQDDSIREIVFRNYRIIYEIVSDKQLTILTIHHHARSINNNPAFKSED